MVPIDNPFNVSDPPGIIAANGEVWKERRRFALRHLRDFGFGKSLMETLVQDEVKELIQELKQKMEEKPEGIDLSHTFNISVLNSLWMIITGKRLKLNNPLEQRRLKNLDDVYAPKRASLLLKLNSSSVFQTKKSWGTQSKHHFGNTFAKLHVHLDTRMPDRY